MPAAPAVVAPLNYLAPDCGAVHTYAYDPPNGAPRFNGRLQAYDAAIVDARQQTCSLERAGFMLHQHASRTRDFWDESEVRARHYPEAEALVRELTGAARAIVFDHTLRRRGPGRPPLDGSGGSFAAVREPVGRVHADYTPRSGPERMRSTLQARGLAPARRFVIVGLWRSLNEQPLLDAPLALADARSLDAADLVPNDLIYRDRRGQTYAIRHSARHRWHYFPRLTRDEVIVFKHYDSAAVDGPRTGAAAHTAFEDPTTPPDAEPRRSLELRVLALFAD